LTREQVRRAIGTGAGADGAPTVATTPGWFFGWGGAAPAIPAVVAPSGVTGVPIGNLPAGTPAVVAQPPARAQAQGQAQAQAQGSTMGASPSPAVVGRAPARASVADGPASQTYPAPYQQGDVSAQPLPPQSPLVLEQNVPWGVRD